MTVGERWALVGGRPSGFDYMRIFLAISVLVWHSLQVSYGKTAALAVWETPFGTPLATILPAFFALSGFLVSGSLYRNHNLKNFLALRIIRIFPALAVEVVLAALILGPIFTTLPLSEYFTHFKFRAYFLNMIGYIHFFLPGVFENNPELGTVNGQLWTVPFELECYALISIASLVGVFKWPRFIIPFFILVTILVIAWNATHGIAPAPAGGVNGRVLVLCFFAGVIVYSFKDVIPWKPSWALVAAVAAIAMMRLPTGSGEIVTYFMPILAAYATVYVGLMDPKRSFIIDSGDYSYGIYLYSYPVQQTVVHLFGTPGGWMGNIAIALPLTVLFALFSWWCVEKPFQIVRRFIGAKPTPEPSAIARTTDPASLKFYKCSQ
jgi:peptidoglycan/LPS O-acetylase OafA/YrhL